MDRNALTQNCILQFDMIRVRSGIIEPLPKLFYELRYSPDQPRDEHGRFTFGNGGGSSGEGVDKSEKSDIIGLGAKGNSLVEPHPEPVFVKHIDINDKTQVDDTIRSFEQNAVSKQIETACVITSQGDVYHCTGVKDAVYPDYDLGDKIVGSIISHNHPISETEYSFSKDDVRLFQNYKLSRLRGFDEKYSYELDNNSKFVDAEPQILSFETAQHITIIEIAHNEGFGYRRWSND